MKLRFASFSGASHLGLGSFRFLLATLVASSHLWFKMMNGYAAYAVWGFFVLSGYLMTYVLMHKYGFSRDGLLAYFKNRCLRILPFYYIALVIGIFTLYILGQRGTNFTALSGQFIMPRTALEWAFPLTLCKVFPTTCLPVPVANALGIEVCAYFLMPILARWRLVSWLVLLGSLGLNFCLGMGLDSFWARYGAFWPCLAPFAVGALLVHYRATLRKLLRGPPLLSIAVWLAYGLTVKVHQGWPWSYGLYVSVLLSAWAVLALVEVRPHRGDTLAGDLSYPVYLLHMTVGMWFLPVFGSSRPLRFFAASFVVTLFLSWLLVRFLEKPLKALKAPPAIKPLIAAAQKGPLISTVLT